MSDDESDNISSDCNVVYFHAPVSRTTVHSLITEMNSACANLKSMRFTPDAHIKLYIHSEGGDVYAGLSAMDHVKNCEFPVHTYVDGYVASAATFILLGGRKRFMSVFSEVLIHQFSTGFVGKYADLLDFQKNSEKLMKMFREIYKTKTKIPTKVLNTILSKEMTFSSHECLNYKIVDELI